MSALVYAGAHDALRTRAPVNVSKGSDSPTRKREVRVAYVVAGGSSRGSVSQVCCSGSVLRLGREKSRARRTISAALAVEQSGGVNEKSKQDALAVDRGDSGTSPADGQERRTSATSNKAELALDYLELLPEDFKNNEGSPRWLFPVGTTSQSVPVLLYLPEIFSVGLGFAMHQEQLARLFELRRLHIPVMDRTPFEGLVSMVEGIVREEARLFPQRPIYLLGESFGAALALAVASRNPKLDLVLILVNPTTSFRSSQLEPLLPILEAVPSMVPSLPLLLGFLKYNLFHMASRGLASLASSLRSGQISSRRISDVLRALLETVNSIPKDALSWKIKMLQTSAQYANSRLQGVRADVLILASSKDEVFPSLVEARRLNKILTSCTYRQFHESNHMLLVEEDFELASVVKSTGYYRVSKLKDVVTNFVPPTQEEFDRYYGTLNATRRLLSTVFFSTDEDGRVVQGLSNIPQETPLIFVGNHAFYGMDLGIVYGELVKETKVIPRGLAHPILFDKVSLEEMATFVQGDTSRLFGAVPVSGKNMYKILSRGESVLLYPGGAREALCRKGEWHKIFWPDRPEVVKMAARFGATIIPLCTVGEDDIYELLLDYDDLVNLPFVGDRILESFNNLPLLRTDSVGELGDQILHTPVASPKFPGPGRLYVLFGKPIVTQGRQEFFSDPKNVDAVYQELKGEVEGGISYLVVKREEDPYRHFIPRVAYEIGSGGKQAPTFTP